MAKNFKELMEGYCRACLKEWRNVELQSEPLKKHVISPEIANKLLSCTSVSIEANDEYPKNLCNFCYDQLNEFDAFRSMCISSMHRFKEMIELASENVEKMKDERELETTERTIIEDDKKQILNVDACVEAEMHRLGAEEWKSMKNPLEIDSKEQRKRERSNVTLRRIKHPKFSTKTVKSGSPRNNGPLISEFIETKIENEYSSRFIGRQSKRLRQKNSQESDQQQQLESEYLKCKSTKVFQCDLCSMRFFVEHRYTAHKRTHEGLTPYPCPHKNCSRGFERWHSFSEHLKQHEGTNRWYFCEEEDCNRRYKHKATLDLHLRRYHKKGPELKSFVCEICGKVFKSSAILNDHRFTHKEKSELPFACHQAHCKCRFSNKAKLKIHMMRHAGIKKYACPHCGMRKTTRNELNIHINYHTLERRFPCQFCSQVCNNAGNLKVHIRTVHEGAKDYACRFCERTFAKLDTRKYHEMIHTGEKPHECADCGKRFVQPAALRRHKTIHLRKQTQCDSKSSQEDTHDEKKSNRDLIGQ